MEKEYSRKKSLNIKSDFQKFLKEVIKQRAPIFYSLNKKYIFKGEILELGAGSCWLSALISKIPEVKNIQALDISSDLLETIGNKIISCLDGEKAKINLVSADFSKLPFSNNKFDIIVVDAALHHAQNLPHLLKEANRVLKQNGFLIAIREPIKSSLYFLHLKKFGKSEIAKGATENIYGKKDWQKYFKQSGFTLCFVEDFSKGDAKTALFKIPPFRFLNGLVFCRYHLFAKKQEFEI